MKTLNLENRKMLPAALCSLFLVWTACSGEAVINGPEEGEIPVTVQAEISNLPNDTRTDNAAEDPANAYDRSRFVEGDVILVTRTYSGNNDNNIANYKLESNGRWSIQGSLSLRIGATYQATFPTNYNGIEWNQSTTANYLKSNLLKTPDISSSTGELQFTGANAFVHQNTKITLVFTGAATGSATGNVLSGTFSDFTITGEGLYSGKATQETMYFYRPAGTATWCGIVYPKNQKGTNVASTAISLSLIYENVNYKTEISCPMVAGQHYRYNLKIQNNILVPDGMEIEGWLKGDETTGNFDPTTT